MIITSGNKFNKAKIITYSIQNISFFILITGRGIEGFPVPYMWPTVPFGYPFSTGIDDFIPCYKKSAKELGASRMKDIMITHDKDNLNVRLFF